MEKFLYFKTANNDALMYPVSRLLIVEHAADTAILMKFEGSAQDTTVEEDNFDIMNLVITADTEQAVMRAIADAIAAPGIAGNKGFIIIADDVTGEYIHEGVTSLGDITPDA